LNTDDTDVAYHRKTEGTATASLAMVLVLLLLMFQCSMALESFSGTKSVQ
jgi:hypothetical protein